LITRPLTVRVRELLPDGTTRERFPGFRPDPDDVRGMRLSGGGEYLLVRRVGRRPENRSVLYDAETGRPVPVPADAIGAAADVQRLSADGTRAFAYGVVGSGPAGMVQLRLPGLALLRFDPGLHPDSISTDEAGAVGVSAEPVDGRAGVFVYRVGEPRPLAVLDAGHQPLPVGITPDGRFAHWGREDGSARVADLGRVLKSLTAMGGGSQ
jgi:hypothetical protein